MTPHTGTGQVLATAAIRAAWAGVLLVLPERLLRASGPVPVPAAAMAVARVLGVRHLAQAALSVAVRGGPVTGLGAVVDTVHTGTCLALAAVSPRWRRAALLDAAVESGFAAAGWRGSGRRTTG
jgi:hypothetical protein